MRFFGWFIAACITIALLRYLMAFLAVLAIIGMIGCLFRQPRETLGLCLIVAIASQPATALALLAILCAAGLTVKAIEKIGRESA